MKLRVNDEILVMSGKDKGRHGKVSKIFLKEGLVLIPGLNIYKKHQKSLPAQAGGQKGGVFEFSRPLLVNKVTLVCPNCSKATRVGFEELRDGTKVRVCRKCKMQIKIESRQVDK